MNSILKLTYYEYSKRKVFIVSIILYGLVSLIILLGIGKNASYLINPYFLSFLFYFSLLFLIFSGFDTVPVMIEDGSVELLLSRPIGRIKLVIYKYVSTLLVIPIGTFIFFILISFIYFIKTGNYSVIFFRVFLFTLLTFAIYCAAVLPFALYFCRTNLNLLLCLVLITANVFPNLINWLTMGQVQLVNNYLIGFFYAISPRLVELCGLATNSGKDSTATFAHSAAYIILCFFASLAVMNKKDF